MRKYNNYLLILVLIISSLLLVGFADKSQFIVKKSGSKPWLGVQVKDLSEKMLKNLDIDYGVKVIKVYENSPAEGAGVAEDDILISFDGKKIHDSSDLIDLVQDSDIDKEVELVYLRDGNEAKVNVKLGKSNRKVVRKWYNKKMPHKFYMQNDDRAWLGVEMIELGDQLREFFDVPENTGVLIKEVIEDSPAEKAGLKAGDVIIRLGEKKIRKSKDVVRAVDYFEPGDKVEVEIIRDKDEEIFNIELGKHKGNRDIYFYGDTPHDIHIDIPEIDIDIPHDFDIEIFDDDYEELEDLDEIKEDMKELKEDIKKEKVRIKKMKVKSYREV